MPIPNITRVGMPLAEFLELNAEQPFELIDGERIPLRPTVQGHTEVIKLFFRYLDAYALQRKWGEAYFETTFILPSADLSDWVKGSRTPDGMFYVGDRVAEYKAMTPNWRDFLLMLVPDLVIEVVSPNDKIVELDRKIEAYLADGVQLIWVLYPHSRKAIIYSPDAEQPHHLNINGVLDGEAVLPDFQVSLAKVFE